MKTRKYTIKKEDIIKRLYFITKLVQTQTSSTMHGALTSKSDSMGGIFDRFINTISDEIVFDKLILPEIDTKHTLNTISDYYLYKPAKNGAGIAPDVFGIKVNGKTIPFVEFDDKWKSIPNTPQIEVKTFKEKDQMVSLRNQGYEEEYLVLVDLNLRIDYLVPFLAEELFTDEIFKKIKMDDNIFKKTDTKSQIQGIDKINFSSNDIGSISLIAITTAQDFMNQSTLCSSKISVRRMKEIKERKIKIKNSLNISLEKFATKSLKADAIYEYNKQWYNKTNVKRKEELYLDFSATNIEKIIVCKINKFSVVIEATENGCSFNEEQLKKGYQYTILFQSLNRKGNSGKEYFMQKQCAIHLNNCFDKLKEELICIIEKYAC